MKETNTRTTIVIPKDLKKQLEIISENKNRSFSNLLVTILKDYVSKNMDGKEGE